ncbi:MAG: hypothetical protein NTY64_20670 [Deltaproteobacteria bacterium]|nr:hypothetical protein [Deltaproteobacteria bacterium]
MRFTFVAAAYHPSSPHSGDFVRRVPRNAGELFTQPSFWRLFARSSILPFLSSKFTKISLPWHVFSNNIVMDTPMRGIQAKKDGP